jgi:putative transposase
MKKSRFTETQIVSILKQADAGILVKDICRQAAISVPTYYKWKSKYGGLEASELRRVKDLEAENARLKRMYAELALDNAAMKDLIAKKNCRAGAEARGRAVPGRGARTSPGPVPRVRRVVAGGLVPAAAALDGARRRDHRGAGRTDRDSPESRLLEVLQGPAPCAPGLESQADLPGVQGHEAQPAPEGQATATQARVHTAVRPAPARHRLVSRFHG